MGDRYATRLGISDADRREERLTGARYVVADYVFDGENFPSGRFVDPALLEEIMGPHRVQVMYVDASFQPCEKAVVPGRYGVVAEVLPEAGGAFYRYATLSRTAAAVMMGGGGGDPEAFRRIPTWMVFGEHETAPRIASGRHLVSGLQALGATDAMLVMLPGMGHGVENQALADPALHDWLARQRQLMPF